MNIFVHFARVMAISLDQMRVSCSRHVTMLVLSLSLCTSTHIRTQLPSAKGAFTVSPLFMCFSPSHSWWFLHSLSHSFSFCKSRSHSLSHAHPPSNPLDRSYCFSLLRLTLSLKTVAPNLHDPPQRHLLSNTCQIEHCEHLSSITCFLWQYATITQIYNKRKGLGWPVKNVNIENKEK